ncbi:MAG: U32 family peptidase, partial [Melioribacter sp.]|nr:U32 family peptidase [Melioribacter sp.]
ETFIHGAMCIAVSGRCFMSHEVFNKSANRGECLQPCRREYEIYDKDEKFSLLIGDGYVLSPKDLCTIDFIDKLIEAKIDAFKIEGRKRSPEYIYKVTSVYRNAIDLYFENKLTDEIKLKLTEELSKVYNRGFSKGFYFGTPGIESYANAYGSIATTRKIYIGKVLNYYKKNKIAYVKIEANDLIVGDAIYIIGNTTGIVELKIEEMMQEENKIIKAEKGFDITFPCKELVRENDKVYKIISTQA